MNKMSQLDAQVQQSQHGVIVEDITPLVEWYKENLSLHPVTNQQYTYDDITAIICQFPQAEWNMTQQSRLYMECCLQREIISDMRLDAIQYSNAINDIESIVKLARDSGV